MKYSPETLHRARNLKIRFSLVKMRDQCNSKIENFHHSHKPYTDIFDWVELKKNFDYLLKYYDNNGELNEEFIIQLYNIKFNDNILAIRRLIKLIKIV